MYKIETVTFLIKTVAKNGSFSRNKEIFCAACYIK